MPSYPLDVDPEQVVRWIMDEQRAAPSRFRILARRGAEAGPRLPEKGALAEGEEQISLSAFYNEFIRCGRGVANVFAEAEDKVAEARIEQLVSSIEKNRHDPDRSRSAR